MTSQANVSAKEMASREDCLESLGDFIEHCQETITSMLDTLGWTPEHFMQPRTLCQCPHDVNHRMSKCSLEKHAPVCEIINQGYSREDAEKVLEDRSYFYKDASCVYTVKPDLETLNSVLWNHHVQNHSVFYGYKKVPRTAEEEQALMSREDRSAMADYIIRRAKEANRLKELGQDELLVSENLADLIRKDNEERRLDPVEEMAALRDYRRRRQTYRAKNVHITKKSHTEIMREVINNQMDMHAQSVREQMGEPQQPESDTEKERDSRDRRSRDEESYRGRDRVDRSRDKVERSRDRVDRSSHRDSRKYSRSRSRDRSDRSSRRSRSWSRERSSGYSRYVRDEQLSTSDRSTRDSRRRSRSRSKNRGKSKYKHRSRSRSHSSERHKKSKHKKHKHKHKKHKHSARKSEDRDSDGGEVNTEIEMNTDLDTVKTEIEMKPDLDIVKTEIDR